MNNLLSLYLSLSVQGGIIALLIFAVKKLFKDMLSMTWQYYIWLVVLVRLLVPFSVEVGLPFEAAPFVGVNNVGVNNFTWVNRDTKINYIDTEVEETIVNTSVEAEQKNKKNSSSISTYLTEIKSSLWIFWLVIAAMLLVRKVTSYKSFVRYIKAGASKVDSPFILDTYYKAFDEAGVKPIGLYINKLVSSPMLVGLFRPIIVIPQVQMGEKELLNIFNHELMHFKRFDIFYKWLGQIALCLHWFNPVVYFVNKEIGKCCELSCDEAIIKKLDREGKKGYGDTLLATIQFNGSYGDSVASVTLNEDASLLRERLGAIMKFKKSSRLVVFCSLVVAALFVFGAAVKGVYAKPVVGTTVEAVKVPQAATSNSASESYSGAANNTAPVATEQKFNYPTTYINNRERTTLTKGFFINKYFVSLMIFDQSISKDLATKLSNFTTIRGFNVAFNNNTKSFATNADVLEVLEAVPLDREFEEWKLSMQEPILLVAKVDGPYNETADELAQKFYEEGNLPNFSNVVPYIGEEKLAGLLKRAYKDKDLSSFSILSGYVTNEAFIEQLAQTAYDENYINFFSVFAYRLGAAKKIELAETAYNDKNINLFSVLAQYLSNPKKAELAQRAYDEKNTSFFSVLSNSLNQEKLAEFLRHSYNEKNTTFFSIMAEKISDQALIDELGENAYNDKQVSFLAIISGELSSAKHEELLSRAIKEKQTSLMNVLE